MHKIHQVTPYNAKRHLVAIGYFFYDRISVSMQAPLPPSLTAYMEQAKGLLLIAYQGPTAIACLSMKAHNSEEAIIDSLSFALEAEKDIAQEMIEQAMEQAVNLGYRSIHAKQRALNIINPSSLGFEPSPIHDRYLHCDLTSTHSSTSNI